MRDIEKEIFINNFNVEDYDQELVDSIEDFEAKIKGEVSLDKYDLERLIKSSEDVRFLNVSEITCFKYAFEGSEYKALDLSRWSTLNVNNMNNMFENCRDLEKLNLSGLDTGNVESMSEMFKGCERLTEIDLSSFDISKVSSLEGMFYNCNSLKEINVSSFDTSHIKNMSYMFSGCDFESINISNFKTESLENVSYMFQDCKKLKEIDFSGFEMKFLKESINAFSGCKSLESLKAPISAFTKARYNYGMFKDCDSLLLDLNSESLKLSKMESLGFENFKCRFDKSNLNKKYDIETDLLELAFLDNSEELPFIDNLKGKGNLSVYELTGVIHLIESEGVGYSVNSRQMDKLKESGVLMKIEEPKMKNIRKNKM